MPDLFSTNSIDSVDSIQFSKNTESLFFFLMLLENSFLFRFTFKRDVRRDAQHNILPATITVGLLFTESFGS